MTVLNVALIALAAMTGVVVLLALPLIFMLKEEEARQEIPREIYDRRQPRIFGLRVLDLGFAIVCLDLISNALHWSQSARFAIIVESASFALFAIVLTSQLIWAIRINRVSGAVDERLRSYARYAMWSSAAGLILMAAMLLVALIEKSNNLS